MTAPSYFPIEPGLAALETRLQRELSMLDLPAKPWVPPFERSGSAVVDVAIIGGGMAGLAACGPDSRRRQSRHLRPFACGIRGSLGHDGLHGDAALA